MNRNQKGQFLKGAGVVDMTGFKSGRLTVLRMADKRSGRKTYWECQCECGNVKVLRSDTLTRKDKPVRSCGCLRDEQAIINVKKNHLHRDSRSHLHYLWLRMKQRCLNTNDPRYSNYGGRGISVCEEWLKDYQVFRDWAYSNGYSEDLSIERKDVNGNYCPENCEWIPFTRQANNRTTTIWVEWQGETLSLTEWSKKLGINYGTLNSRYRRSGLRPPELFQPVKKR